MHVCETHQKTVIKRCKERVNATKLDHDVTQKEVEESGEGGFLLPSPVQV